MYNSYICFKNNLDKLFMFWSLKTYFYTLHILEINENLAKVFS